LNGGLPAGRTRKHVELAATRFWADSPCRSLDFHQSKQFPVDEPLRLRPISSGTIISSPIASCNRNSLHRHSVTKDVEFTRAISVGPPQGHNRSKRDINTVDSESSSISQHQGFTRATSAGPPPNHNRSKRDVNVADPGSSSIPQHQAFTRATSAGPPPVHNGSKRVVSASDSWSSSVPHHQWQFEEDDIPTFIRPVSDGPVVGPSSMSNRDNSSKKRSNMGLLPLHRRPSRSTSPPPKTLSSGAAFYSRVVAQQLADRNISKASGQNPFITPTNSLDSSFNSSRNASNGSRNGHAIRVHPRATLL